MSYVTQAQLIERFGQDAITQLTDREGAGVEDDAVISRAITDADHLIDAYVAPRYTLPLAAALVSASPLGRHAAAIVYYLLHEDRVTEPVRQLYTDAISFLKDVRANRASLGEEDTTVASDPGRVATNANTATGANVTAFDWDAY